jgi:hypothetical protein
MRCARFTNGTPSPFPLFNSDQKMNAISINHTISFNSSPFLFFAGLVCSGLSMSINDGVPLEDLTYESMRTTPAKPWCLTLTFIGIIIVIASGGVLVFWFARRHGVAMGLVALRALQPPREEPLPFRWSVNNSYLIPNYGQSSPRLGFSANYHLEATFRSLGIECCELPPSQYVRFSQEWVASLLKSFCYANPRSVFCEKGIDDLAVWSRSLSVEAVPASSSEMRVNFTVAHVDSAGGVVATKRLMLSHRIPPILALPRLLKRFWNGSSVIGTFEIDSDFVFDGESELVLTERNSVPLVAYNDFAAADGSGGFIVRNNWGAVGHTLEYLLGEISIDADRRICPNPCDPSLWTPATVECVNHTTDYRNCSLDLAVVYENATQGAVELECFNETFCDRMAAYVMLRGEQTERKFVLDAGGFPMVIEIKNGRVRTSTVPLPFEFLYHAFRPKVAPKASYEHCGYVVIPYRLLRQIAGKRDSRTDGWRAFSVNLSWPEESFMGLNGGTTASRLRESMYAVPAMQNPVIEFVDFSL